MDSKASPSFKLDKADMVRIAKGFAWASLMGGLGYLGTTVIPNLDHSVPAAVTIAAVASTVLDAAIKWLSDNRF